MSWLLQHFDLFLLPNSRWQSCAGFPLPVKTLWVCSITNSCDRECVLRHVSPGPVHVLHSRSSQLSTSISPSVSMSSGWLVLRETEGFAASCASPLCSSCTGLEMAAGPLQGAWLSPGWTGGARGIMVRLGAGRASWLLEKGLHRHRACVIFFYFFFKHLPGGFMSWLFKTKSIRDDSPLHLILSRWFLFFGYFRRPWAESGGPLLQLDLFEILEHHKWEHTLM